MHMYIHVHIHTYMYRILHVHVYTCLILRPYIYMHSTYASILIHKSACTSLISHWITCMHTYHTFVHSQKQLKHNISLFIVVKKNLVHPYWQHTSYDNQHYHRWYGYTTHFLWQSNTSYDNPAPPPLVHYTYLELALALALDTNNLLLHVYTSIMMYIYTCTVLQHIYCA